MAYREEVRQGLGYPLERQSFEQWVIYVREPILEQQANVKGCIRGKRVGYGPFIVLGNRSWKAVVTSSCVAE